MGSNLGDLQAKAMNQGGQMIFPTNFSYVAKGKSNNPILPGSLISCGLDKVVRDFNVNYDDEMTTCAEESS